MKRLLVSLAIVILGLAACGEDDDAVPPKADTNGHRLYVETLEHDGRTYTCIIYDDDRHAQGGLWCERRGSDLE